MSDQPKEHQHESPPLAPEREPVPGADRPVGPTPAANVPDAPATSETDESTVGTGTSIALGCLAGTVLLIVLGLIVIGLIALIG